MGTEANYNKTDGCDIATLYLEKQSHCKECPFPDCLLGTAAGKELKAKLTRNQEIRKLRQQQGMTIKELQSRFDISQSMIYYILAGGTSK